MAAVDPKEKKDGEITPSELVTDYFGKADRKDYVILDCREKADPDDDDAEDEEYDGGHIKGSIHVDYSSDIKDIFDNHTKSFKIVIIYGLHAASNADDLVRRYKNDNNTKDQTVYILKGGYTAFVNHEMAWTVESEYAVALRRDLKNDYIENFRLHFWRGSKEGGTYVGPPTDNANEVQQYIDKMGKDATKVDEKADN